VANASLTKKKENATGVARQRRRQRLPTARQPDLQARFLKLPSGHRSQSRSRSRSQSRSRSPCYGSGGDRGALPERLLFRRFLRALTLVGFDLRFDRREGPLVVLLF